MRTIKLWLQRIILLFCGGIFLAFGIVSERLNNGEPSWVGYTLGGIFLFCFVCTWSGPKE